LCDDPDLVASSIAAWHARHLATGLVPDHGHDDHPAP
jgi:hypothetical protein